jgi:hypothetical protein
MDDEKLIILVQELECVYSLQHVDNVDNLVTVNCWEEQLATFMQKEQAAQYFVQHKKSH